MKPGIYSATLCGLFLAVASQTAFASDKASGQPRSIFATNASNGARLSIKRSPVLGDNIAITMAIDGKVAGTLIRARTFDEYIVLGRHVLVASPNRLRGDWRGTIDLRAGETYVFVAKYNVDRLVLERVKTAR